MSNVITPTIGRRVWYWPSSYDVQNVDQSLVPIAYSDTTQPLDAGVAYVWNDRMVNLSFADQNGKMHSRTNVRLLQPGEDRPEGGGFCEWMTYQKEQAEPKTASKTTDDWKLRVRVECEELAKKVTALAKFLDAQQETCTLSFQDLELLKRQYELMYDYHEVLLERIKRF